MIQLGPGGEGAKEAPRQLGVQAVNQGQESKPREAAGVVVSFGARPVAAAAAASPRPKRLTTVLVVDNARLCCSLCSLALKRHIYQCAVGHLACGSCRVKLRINGCRACRDQGAASDYALCPGLDVFYGDLHLPCPYEQHGCRSYVPYYRAANHQSACEHAPCLCPDPGCAFAAPPPALQAHLAAAHSWPVHRIPRFGAIHSLRVPASSVPDRLLVVGEEQEEHGEDDAAERPAVFVLSMRARRGHHRLGGVRQGQRQGGAAVQVRALSHAWPALVSCAACEPRAHQPPQPLLAPAGAAATVHAPACDKLILLFLRALPPPAAAGWSDRAGGGGKKVR